MEWDDCVLIVGALAIFNIEHERRHRRRRKQ